ncbi:peptidase M20, partial [Xanthomonas campestris pv. campestris]
SSGTPLQTSRPCGRWVIGGFSGATTYFAQCYHQPCDRWTPQWDASGHAADTTLAYDVGVALANNRQWPSWQDGSEFKAIRSKSDAARK